MKRVHGAHLNISQGFDITFFQAADLKTNAFQIFTRSNRQWRFDVLEEKRVEQFLNLKSKSDIKFICSHASYLINMCSVSVETREKSHKALLAELKRCQQLEIGWTVVHPGSYGKLGNEKDALDSISKNMNIVLDSFDGSNGILLENSAGQGTSIPYNIESLARLFEKIYKHDTRVGICIDTCHLWAAGYDISTSDLCEKFFENFDALIGMEYLKVLHVNDSQKECGSRVDRHAHLGQGKIGDDTFKMLCKIDLLKDIPFILEVPYESYTEIKQSLDVLISV